MSAATVTVGVTCHNARSTIEQAIESARAQTFPSREIIVIDDYSSDGSREFLSGYCEANSIRLLLPDRNLGIAAARNELVRHAGGEFVAFFDDDDISMPDRLYKQYEVLQSAASEGLESICYTGRTQVYPDGTKIYEPGLHRPRRRFVDGAEVLQWALVGRYGSRLVGSAGTGTMMAPRRTLATLRFDETFIRCSDTELLVRAVLAGCKIVAVPEPLIIQGMTNSTDKSLDVRWQAHRQLLEKHAPVLSTLGLTDMAWSMLMLRSRLLRRDGAGAARAALSVACRNPAMFMRIALTVLRRGRAIRARRSQLQGSLD